MMTAASQMGQEALHTQSGIDVVSGIRSRVVTSFGRPAWETVFAEVAAAHPGQRVGVFVCGPQVSTLTGRKSATLWWRDKQLPPCWGRTVCVAAAKAPAILQRAMSLQCSMLQTTVLLLPSHLYARPGHIMSG